MAKKTVSGGGGGSNGAPVSWHDALVAELRGPEIPPDAVCVYDVMKSCGVSRCRAQRHLLDRVESGKFQRAYGTRNNRRTWFYWPA